VRDAEGRDLDGAVRGEQQVRRLNVAMNDPGGVCRLQPGRRLGDDIHGQTAGQRAAGQRRLHRGPVGQFRHQVRHLLAGLLAVVVDLGDVLVTEGSGQPRFGSVAAAFKPA
jgi:hypothetical protein